MVETGDFQAQKSRVNYLQNLSKTRSQGKQLDKSQGSTIFNGFTRDELHELLIEMPHLRKLQKQADKRKMQGNEVDIEPKQISNAMIQLDSLQEIAQRGKASSTKLIYQKIMDRKRKAEELVDFEDLKKKHAGADSKKLARQHTLNMQEKQKHQEFMQKF